MDAISFSKNFRIFLIKFLTIILLSTFPINKAAHAAKDSSNVGNLTILSEENMTYALTKIVRDYAKKENVAISINFNSSSELINEIEEGEPADIFISSHFDWVRILYQKGVVDRFSWSNFAHDKLVVITSKNNDKINFAQVRKNGNLKNVLQMIRDKKIPLIVGSDYSSLGKHTKKIIEDSKISNFQIFQKLEEDKKSIIDFVNEHRGYCAIVMKSDVKNYDKVVVLAEVPDMNIDYRALAVAGDNMENARKFIKHLKSKEAQDILAQYGFIL